MSGQPVEDEVFRKSTMTFGEHLEELRTCLFKAVGGLAVGFIIGLLVGGYVVQFIKLPLSRALKNYIDKETVDRVEAERNRLEATAGGATLPWTDKEIQDRVYGQGLLAEDYYIDLAQVLPELKRAFPKQFENVELPSRGEKDGKTETKNAGAEAESDSKKGTDTAIEPNKAKDDRENLVRVYLWRPASEDPRMQIKSLNAQEPFSVYVKASLLVGILLSSPWVFYQIWSFVAAGLYPHERHYVQTYLPFSIGLFLTGAALAFFVVFEPVLRFLFSFNRMTGIAPEPRINEWLGFVLVLPVGFGIGFQLPLVMLFLERIGVFTVKGYLKQWRIAILVIFVLAALLTPPDPYSMMLMATPLSGLYFGGILLCRLMPRKKSTSYELTTTS
jgi:sec-independent protein translocase protein TatC